MIKIGLKDIEKLFQNVRIRFRNEFVKSDQTYLDILLDEIQLYFNKLDTFEFDDSKIFINNDKILTLDKFLYTLTTISNNVGNIYTKTDEIIVELEKLANINIFERDTIIKKLDKIHNFIMSHTITSEQNADYTLYFRENFNDNSNEDKSIETGGIKSEGTEVDLYAGVLKLVSDKTPVSIEAFDLNNISIEFENDEPLIEVGQKVFPSNTYSVGDLHNIDENSYSNKSELELKSLMFDTGDEEKSITSCPFEIIYTKISTDGKDISDIEQKINDIEDEVGDLDFKGKEIQRDYSFLSKYLNDSELSSSHIPKVILKVELNKPTLCSFIDIKFDNEIPKLCKDGGYIKGKVSDNNRSYNIINLDIKDNNPGYPFYRLFWGIPILLTRLEIYFESKWNPVDINLIRWEANLSTTIDTYRFGLSITKSFFTEYFDASVYSRSSGEQVGNDYLIKKLLTSDIQIGENFVIR